VGVAGIGASPSADESLYLPQRSGSRSKARFDTSNGNSYHLLTLCEILPMKKPFFVAAPMLLALAGSPAIANDLPEFTLVVKNHVYQPSELKVPAGTKFKIIVRNEDATPEEFESTDFNREKIVLPNSSITVYVGPLRAGNYGFFGDFHQATAKGRLIVE
jgi:plastocyanin